MKNFLTILWSLLGLGLGFGGVGWLLWRSLRKSDDPARLISKWVISGVIAAFGGSICAGAARLGEAAAFIVPITLAACGIALGVIWAPSWGAILVKPLTSAIDGGDQELEPQPLYSIAKAKRKMGKYSEAIAEIRSQLEKFPTDFTGWMMLAEIQAENLSDLSGAQNTIDRILAQESHSPINIAFALNRLADWHLKLSQDRESARSALERIVELLPETAQAQLARQRMAHLMPQEMLMERHEPHRIQMQHHEQKLGLRPDPSGPSPPPEEHPSVIAASLVKHLEIHPHDFEAREKLALIYAEHFQRLDLASDQLEQLIAIPHQPTKQIVHWLNLLAHIQVRVAGDAGLARQALQRIVDRFPQTAAAEIALHRMAYLNLELKSKQKSQAVKLGSYEQNIGLKDK